MLKESLIKNLTILPSSQALKPNPLKASNTTSFVKNPAIDC